MNTRNLGIRGSVINKIYVELKSKKSEQVQPI